MTQATWLCGCVNFASDAVRARNTVTYVLEVGRSFYIGYNG